MRRSSPRHSSPCRGARAPSGRREKEDAVLRECLGQHQRTHDRRLARAGPADENAQPSRQQPFERNRLFLDRLAMQLVPLVELAACPEIAATSSFCQSAFTGAAGLPARLPRTERSRSSRPFSSVSCSAAVDVAPATSTSSMTPDSVLRFVFGQSEPITQG